jgi:hypothetical protein
MLSALNGNTTFDGLSEVVRRIEQVASAAAEELSKVEQGLDKR